MKIDPNELSFAGIVEEEKEDKRFNEARLQRAKEARLDENLTKEIINHIYQNIGNVKIGEKLDHFTTSIPVMSDECQEVIKAMEPFERDPESPFSPQSLDLFPFLVAYDKARSRINLKKQVSHEALNKIMAELESKQYGQPYQDLAVKLEILSARVNKDVVKDMISRNNLEAKATDLFITINKLEEEVVLYTNIWSEIHSLMDENKKLSDINFGSKEMDLAKKIKGQLNKIVDIEVSRLDNNEFEYGKLAAEFKGKYRDKLLKIKTLNPKQVFDVDNFGFIGLLLEDRKTMYQSLEKKADYLNQRIKQYIPKSMVF